MNDNWRAWLGANLMLGESEEMLTQIMTAQGLDPVQIGIEIDKAKSSPYVRGGTLLSERIKKRDWLLRSYQTLASQFAATDRLAHEHQLDAKDFYAQYYFRHRPVLLTGLFAHWPAMSRWSLEYFEAQVGDQSVQVQFGRDSDPNYEVNNDSHRREMPMREFVNLIRNNESSNDFYMTANNDDHNRSALSSLWSDAGELDGYLDDGSRGGRFFWMGPRGTVTPFHHDLTNNLLVQVVGRKRIKLVASYDTPLMRNHLHCYSEWDGNSLPAGPGAAQRPAVIECELGPGDALFLPVGWWHHVESLSPTIGLSFTNFKVENDYSMFYSTFGAM